MARSKEKIVSFKLEESLSRKLSMMPNKSQFIRNAILSAMNNTCPLCQGTGTLSADQMEHWSSFSSSHSLEQCGECDEYHLVCECSDDKKHAPMRIARKKRKA